MSARPSACWIPDVAGAGSCPGDVPVRTLVSAAGGQFEVTHRENCVAKHDFTTVGRLTDVATPADRTHRSPFGRLETPPPAPLPEPAPTPCRASPTSTAGLGGQATCHKHNRARPASARWTLTQKPHIADTSHGGSFDASLIVR